jgi:hypothetical protein
VVDPLDTPHFGQIGRENHPKKPGTSQVSASQGCPVRLVFAMLASERSALLKSAFVSSAIERFDSIKSAPERLAPFN